MTKARATNDGRVRVTKRKSRKQAPKSMSGLLDVSVLEDVTDIAELTHRNSTESPLLRVPPEIRNRIWKHAVGGLEIHITGVGVLVSAQLSYGTRPIGSRGYLLKHPRVAFHMHQVSRQAYFEVAPFIYTLNTFSFDYVGVMDRWIKNRAFGQMQFVTSINIPSQYHGLYIQGFRRTFRKKFPNIKRIGICHYSVLVRRRMGETIEETKDRIVKQVHEREGDGVVVEW
ncbi:hypothetical protein PSPO01_15057 [Paraphaeosphaeria sporulosa]